MREFAKCWLFWLQHWRHIAAYVYMVICLVDFVIMPLIVFYHNQVPDHALVGLVGTLPQASQVDTLKILSMNHRWDPVTIRTGGIFHIAFGGILGVAALTRGQEKTALAQQGNGDA